MIQKFRTKIVEIEAMRYVHSNVEELANWTGGQFRANDIVNVEFTGQVFDDLHDTWINVKPGMWIVRGAKGEYYPCDDETFHWKYEEVK